MWLTKKPVRYHHDKLNEWSMGAIAQYVYSSRKVLVYFVEVNKDLKVRTAGLKMVNRHRDAAETVLDHQAEPPRNVVNLKSSTNGAIWLTI